MKGMLFMVLALLTAIPAVAQRAATPTVVARIDGATGDVATELVDARSVLLTRDGRFVVINGKPSEARVYDGRGRFQRILGRQGQGPGEYEFLSGATEWTGDSVMVYSHNARKALIFRLDATAAVREWTTEPGELPEERAAVVNNVVMKSGGVLGARGCASSLVAGAIPGSAPFTEALTDSWGRLWSRQVGQDTWKVHTPGGRAVATVTLPRHFVIRQFRGDTAIGTTVDEDGFTNVIAIATRVGAGTSAAGPECDSPPMPVTRVRSAMMRTALRNAMTFAEAFHEREGRYPQRESQLHDGVMLEGTEYRMPVSTAESWVVVLVDKATGYHCLMSIGPGGIPGIEGTTMRCAARLT
ncbi:MAG TPA: hypothetical protein PLL69_02900 [Gemmatimonadales bacterium]|nr:hypothetical protein [Gemmatimonadales bacterium]